MSEIGKIDRVGGRRLFPSRRRSSDPLQPQSGDSDFSAELESLDEAQAEAVQSTEKTEQSIVRDDAQRQRIIRRAGQDQEKEKEEAEGEEEEGGGENSLIDLEV